MKKLIVEPTNKSPRIVFDPISGILELSGKSIPENSYELYTPIISWIEKYVQQPAASTCFMFRLNYFNSSSTEYILEILRKLEILIETDEKRLEVHWHYDKDDEDMLMIGADFQSLLRMPIRMIENVEEDL